MQSIFIMIGGTSMRVSRIKLRARLCGFIFVRSRLDPRFPSKRTDHFLLVASLFEEGERMREREREREREFRLKRLRERFETTKGSKLYDRDLCRTLMSTVR